MYGSQGLARSEKIVQCMEDSFPWRPGDSLSISPCQLICQRPEARLVRVRLAANRKEPSLSSIAAEPRGGSGRVKVHVTCHAPLGRLPRVLGALGMFLNHADVNSTP